ncbi:MAG: hypothetical protein R6U44_06815 [Archaeoglobaceae archaeon]
MLLEAISAVFGLVFIAAVLGTLVSITQPEKILWWKKEEEVSRDHALLYNIVLGFVSLIIIGATAPAPSVDTTTTTTPTATATSTPTPQYEDQEFDKLISDQAGTLRTDMQYIEQEAKSLNYDSLSTYCTLLKSDADMFLQEIEGYKLSPEMQDIREEYRKALEDYKKAGYYCEQGTIYENSDDIYKANDYLEKATNHMEKVNQMR